jgi:iron(III) transport system substrate-binding protein
VDGNSVVVRMVGSGRASVGMTDSDDIAAGQREGLPLRALPLTTASLLIPNTVALVHGGPHPEAAQRLADYLLEPRIAGRLVEVHALEGAERHPPSVAVLNPDWDGLLRDLETTSKQLESIFLR